MAVVPVAVGGGWWWWCRGANCEEWMGDRVVRPGRKLDDDDSPANGSVEYMVSSAQYICHLSREQVEHG